MTDENKRYYSFIIKQAVGGKDVKLIEMESDKPLTRSEALENLEELTTKVHDAKSMFLVIDGRSVVFSKSHGPIQITIREK